MCQAGTPSGSRIVTAVASTQPEWSSQMHRRAYRAVVPPSSPESGGPPPLPMPFEPFPVPQPMCTCRRKVSPPGTTPPTGWHRDRQRTARACGRDERASRHTCNCRDTSSIVSESSPWALIHHPPLSWAHERRERVHKTTYRRAVVTRSRPLRQKSSSPPLSRVQT